MAQTPQTKDDSPAKTGLLLLPVAKRRLWNGTLVVVIVSVEVAWLLAVGAALIWLFAH